MDGRPLPAKAPSQSPAILQPRGFALSTVFVLLFSFLLHLLTAGIGTKRRLVQCDSMSEIGT